MTNAIKQAIKDVATKDNADVTLVEVGGTVGDIESLPFIEAISQFRMEAGPTNTLSIHLTYIPYLESVGELKTKPTQHSVRELCSLGIQPDILVCRTEHELSAEIKNKISYLCNITPGCVIENNDVKTIYEVPLMLEREGLCVKALEKLEACQIVRMTYPIGAIWYNTSFLPSARSMWRWLENISSSTTPTSAW